MDRNLSWMVPELKKLFVRQQAPGSKYARMYRKPLERIETFFRRIDESEWSAVLEFIFGQIANHFRGGGAMSSGLKMLADAVALQVYTDRNLKVIRQHFFWQDTRTDMAEARAEALFVIAFFKLVGESEDQSIEFCQMILDEHAYWEETFVRNGSHSIPFDVFNSIPWIRAVLFAAAVPVADFMPQKRWLENIISAARYGDPEAKRCVQGIFELIRLVWESVTVMSQTAYVVLHGLPDRTFALDIPHDLRDFQMTLILSDSNADWAAKQMQHTQREQESLGLKANNFIDWVLSHTDALGRSFDRKVQEMLHQPRYGLLRNGYDSVLVQLSPLKLVALTSFSFYPDNGSLDDLRIQFNRKTLGDRLCQLMLQFRNFSLVDHETLFPKMILKRAEIFTSILEYAVVDAMHSIICREPRKNEAGDDVPREKSHDADQRRREVVVRPFLRRLPVGYTASDAARDRAFLELGWYLPDGVTFVQSHERYAGLPALKPPPLFTYTDEMFMRSIS